MDEGMTKKRLQHLSGRLEELFYSHPQLRPALDDTIGAVFALMLAEELGYKDRPHSLPSEYLNIPLKRARDMRRGKVRKDGKWAAGFYFNSALMRIAATYHRVLMVVTGKKGKVGKLVKEVKGQFGEFPHQHLDDVHDEVNDIKHSPKGISGGRKVTFEEVIAALEELVDLIEKKKIRDKLIKTVGS